jgi:DHA2 family multidrug resistance protein
MVLLQSVGQSFTLLPIVIIALSNSDPSRATAFAAYIQVMRLGGAEIGIALMGTWLRVREQIHSNILGQNLGTGDADVAGYLAQLTARFSSHGAGSAQGRSVGTLASLVAREANVLA